MRKCLPLTTLQHDGPVVVDLAAREQKLIDETERQMCAVPKTFIEVDYATLELRIAAQLAANLGRAKRTNDWFINTASTGLRPGRPAFVDYPPSVILCPRSSGKTPLMHKMMKDFVELAKKHGKPFLISNSEYEPRRHVDRRPPSDYAQQDAEPTKLVWDSLATPLDVSMGCSVSTGRPTSDEPCTHAIKLRNVGKSTNFPFTFNFNTTKGER